MKYLLTLLFFLNKYLKAAESLENKDKIYKKPNELNKEENKLLVVHSDGDVIKSVENPLINKKPSDSTLSGNYDYHFNFFFNKDTDHGFFKELGEFSHFNKYEDGFTDKNSKSPFFGINDFEYTQNLFKLEDENTFDDFFIQNSKDIEIFKKKGFLNISSDDSETDSDTEDESFIKKLLINEKKIFKNELLHFKNKYKTTSIEKNEKVKFQKNLIKLNCKNGLIISILNKANLTFKTIFENVNSVDADKEKNLYDLNQKLSKINEIFDKLEKTIKKNFLLINYIFSNNEKCVKTVSENNKINNKNIVKNFKNNSVFIENLIKKIILFSNYNSFNFKHSLEKFNLFEFSDKPLNTEDFYEKNKKYFILNSYPDGNCGYHCILYFLYKFMKEDKNDVLIIFNKKEFLYKNFSNELVDLLFDTLGSLLKSYENYFDLNYQDQNILILYLKIILVSHLIENKEFYSNKISFLTENFSYSTYLLNYYLINFNNWIDGLAFAAFSNVFKLKIVIYEINFNKSSIYNVGLSENFNHRIDLIFKNNHYDLLIAK